jgi:XTP/dITP diphosphohydrolase
LAWPDGYDKVFTGVIKGTLIWPPKGTNGHGFDPMFQPEGYQETFGEMNRWVKNRLSHRGLAFTKMIKQCFIDKY